MRIVLVVSLFVFAISCSSQKNATTTSFQVADIIRQLEFDAISAEFRLDTAAIASILHTNFVAVYPHKLQNKQQELDGIYRGILQRQQDGETMDSLYLDDFRAQVYGNTAIVTFFTVTKGRRKTGPYENQRWRWYDVWVKEKGKWKLVSAQGTPIMK